MQSKAVFRPFLLISVLLIFSMACGLVSQVGELKSTADALATQAASGIELLGTGQAIATDIGESGIKETLQAIATDVDESGVKETVQAAATKFDESGMKETVQAKVTELPSLSGEKPQDIPLVTEVEDVIASANLVSYFTSQPFQVVVDFYEREMLVNGWTKIAAESNVVEHLATLNYQKDGRKATVIITEIPVINQTTVVISIQGG